jgi:predicted naringenin-chalcone synthase
VAGIGSALPPAVDHEALWDGFFAQHYGHDRVAEKIWAGAGITTRHAAVDPRVTDVSGWDTGTRMRRYLREAAPLGTRAAAAALADAGVSPAEVGLLAVVSCTGYVTPGLDVVVARELGLPADTQRLLIGHMGCYAALPGLGAAADFVASRGRAALLLCVELPSLHLQPPTTERDQMVAHALFGDAAAAAVLVPAPGAGLAVLDVTARTGDAATSGQMTWDVTATGFRMGLSPRVPAELARHVGPLVEELLTRHSLGVSDVAGWAVHPGGRRILEVVSDELALPVAAMEPSYAVLRDVGNCSSATVLLVIDRLRAAGAVGPGDHLVALAFGPGLTLYASLLRRSR